MFAISLVHRGEVIHVFQEYARADDLRETAASSLQNLRQITQNSVRLQRYVSRDHFLCGGIDGYLAGEKDESVGFDCLRVRAYRLRGILWWKSLRA